MKKQFKVYASKRSKAKSKIVASQVWDNPLYDRMTATYMPSTGEGDTMASQTATALNKLIYKWYNDGDVYDNHYGLEGFANDISGCANWLYKYLPQTQDILEGIYNCTSEEEYEQILYKLAEACWDDEDLEYLNRKPKQGSIYNCDGPFSFEEDLYEEDDEW